MTWDSPTEADYQALEKQLGRPMRGLVGIAARCACGAPAVVVTEPRLPDGTPFPTLYYMSLPEATKEASRLEAAGKMVEYQERLVEDPEAKALYEKAHESFLHTRTQLGVVDEIDGISAGGMPDRVKCLHSLMAHSLAVGTGVNPAGDWALADSSWSIDKCQCRPDDL